MKLAPLLAQFLYSNKRLDLPGIGTIVLNSAVVEDPDPKQPKGPRAEDISFENNPSIKDSPELVQYIASQTGKIRALAAADLDSHLSLVLQFLHIGKPFLLEGIGSLVKLSSGEYAFVSGDVLSDKLKAYTPREISATSSTEQSFSDYKKPINRGAAKNWRKPAAIFLVIAGVALAVWGGYTVYKITTAKNRSAKKEEVKPEEPAKNETVLVTDSNTKDTVQARPVTNIAAPLGSFRFVIEKANEKRALSRFNYLKNACQWNVQLEKNDSLNYTIFMVIPAAAADTSRINDSLSRLSGKRVYAE